MKSQVIKLQAENKNMNGTNTIATKTNHYQELIKKIKKRKGHEASISDRFSNKHGNT